MVQEKQKSHRRLMTGTAAAVLILMLGAGAFALFRERSPEGCWDYTVSMEQYFVEYSEQYDYWDVITVEYPVLSGIDGERAEAVNGMLYDIAMDKVNYWHLMPDEEVKALQEEYSLYCSDVRCDVTFHSQFLLSTVYHEVYAPISPVYYVHMTQRSANVNLMTGRVYELGDVIEIDDAFMELWCRRASEDYRDVIFDDEDSRETFRKWFMGEDRETEEYYMFRPFFYVTGEGDFVAGLSVDPNVRTVANNLALDTSFAVELTGEETMPYRKESDFWECYEESQTVGKVLPCSDLQENLWLGEDAGVWDLWER